MKICQDIKLNKIKYVNEYPAPFYMTSWNFCPKMSLNPFFNRRRAIHHEVISSVKQINPFARTDLVEKSTSNEVLFSVKDYPKYTKPN